MPLQNVPNGLLLSYRSSFQPPGRDLSAARWACRCRGKPPRARRPNLCASADVRFLQFDRRNLGMPAGRNGSTVSQASGEGERPVLRRAELLHCLSASGFGSGSVRRICPRLRKTARGHSQAKFDDRSSRRRSGRWVRVPSRGHGTGRGILVAPSGTVAIGIDPAARRFLSAKSLINMECF